MNSAAKEQEQLVTRCELVMLDDPQSRYEQVYDEPVLRRKALADLSRAGWPPGEYDMFYRNGILTVFQL